MILSIALFKNIFISMETVAFTSLIFTEYAMILSEVEIWLNYLGKLNSVHIIMIITNILSTAVYLLAIFIFPE